MPSGEWSFIHEWMLYEYMINKYNEGTLRLKYVVMNGKISLKTKYVKVIELGNISNTDFPDITSIKIEGDQYNRVSEVKFITSKFEYHKKKYKEGSYTYSEFLDDRGCIIVLAHDEMPLDLNDPIDVFELEQEDFVSYVRENLSRLLNRQMRKSSYNKIWIMYQGPNFVKGTEKIKPAKESGKWCPSENLTGFELGLGDTVIFIRTKGCRFQDLTTDKIHKWKLQDIFISKVTLSIMSREHYCQYKGISENSILWYDETEQGKKDTKIRIRKNKEKFRWKRVFEFKKEDEFNNLGLYMEDMPSYLGEFKEKCIKAFKNHISSEIDTDEFLRLLQYVAKMKI